MDCLHCLSQIADVDLLFFFCKGEKDVHLSIKPECEAIAKKQLITQPGVKKKKKLACYCCNSSVGCVLPLGPGGTDFFAFAADKVKLCGIQLNAKRKWWNCYTEFSSIQRRDINNFFNHLSVNVDSERKGKTQEYEKITFPTLANLSDFEWFSVSLEKNPRAYQIEAFIEVLQRNLIAVIKTGAGKTLIASMFLGRMCSLNPNLMGLMIVDRIPLVFQQAGAIESDTNLRVIRLCGENRTAYIIKAINDGTYNVLVVTAGSFFEMAKRKEIDIKLFCAVVFDECHHAAGNHKYMDVLKLFTKNALSEQPRILGLSASLFNANTIVQAEKHLEHYVQNFGNAKIYCPKLTRSHQTVEKKVVTLTAYQKDFIHKVVVILNQLLSEICMLAGVPIKDMQMRVDLVNSNNILGYLRALEVEHYSISNFNHKVKMCYIAIDSLDICSALCVEEGRKFLQEYPIFADIVDSFNCNSLTNRLEELQKLLENVCEKSKVLIFVSSRKVARALFDILDKQFPHFNMQKVFGHGGFDGMMWEGDQEKVLTDFRDGSCNLLICTSVLEEGLDVASCDLVICYTGVTTLIQYIQSRGRARKAGSQFIIFHSEEDYSRINQIESSEGMLEAVLNVKPQFDACHLDISKDIMMKVKQGMSMNEEKRQPLLLDKQVNSQEFTFNLYIGVPDRIDVNALESKIIEKLEECQSIKVNRFEEVITDVELELFSPETTITYLVGAIPRIVRNNAYIQFCQVFDFEIEIDGAKLKIWTQNHNIYQELDKPTSVECCGYKVGYLNDKSTASIGSILREDSIVVRFIPDLYIEIRVDDGIVRIPFGSIGKFCLISIATDKFILAFPLKYPPFIYYRDPKNEDQIGERVSIEGNGPLTYELQRFANNPVLFIVFDINKLNDVKRIASSPTLFPVYLFHARLDMLNFCDTHLSSDLDVTSHSHVADIMYTMKCIKDCRMLSFPSSFQDFLIDFIAKLELDVKDLTGDTLELVKVTLHVLYNKIISRGEYFLNAVHTFNTIYYEFSNISVNHRSILLPPVPENHFLIKRIVVTPSRDIALPAVPVASNRLLRLLDSTEEYRKYDIIIVSFKDEHMGKARSCYDRIETVMKEGIWIHGIEYNFLLASGSQLRDGKAFFISCTYQEVLSLRRKIIPDLKNFKSAAKYLSRLGQYGTADKFVCKVSFDSVAWIDDIKASNGDLTTDGAGKISMSLANQIATTEGITVPSAFQVRYSGVKGILVTCLDSDPDFKGKAICFRQSQRKFSNEDEDLCIVGVSKFYDLTLNRESITLLSAIPCDWELDKTLLNYQENYLAKYCDMFSDNRAAQQLLSEFLPTLQSSNFNFIEEEYFFSLLQGIYRTKVQGLKNKTNIPVAEGCILIGAPDPTGLLKENEVFVQLKRDGCEAEVKCCPALIYRNPCLHPGDQRRVNCVDVVELHHLYNVILMPAKDCAFSLASVCSGGDLDGDKFSILWDPLLVPDDQFIYPPCNYTELGDNTIKDAYCDMEDKNELSKFYCEVMKNDCLGRIATTHLAICDILPRGARDPVAVEMAKSQAQAVDFPKTGVLPQVPDEALKEVKEKGFPDFMQKAFSESYTSKKVLGDLYRRCISGGYDFSSFRKSETDILMNMKLLVDGNEEYLSDAHKTYNSYVHSMEIVMVKFQLKVEADVVLGYATYGWSEFFQGDSGKLTDAITGSFHSIVQRYRKIFFSNALDAESQKKKASAWYRVVNDPEIKKTTVKSGRKIFLSFPWVVHDVLHDIISEGNHEQPSRIHLQIGESAWNQFKEKSCNLEKQITEKVKISKKISCAINQFVRERFSSVKDEFLVELYGSTSIYVCELESDVDVFVASPELYESFIDKGDCDEKENKIYFLKSVVSPALDMIATTKTELLDRNYPIIKCSIKGDDNSIQCDISMNEVGIRKTRYILV